MTGTITIAKREWTPEDVFLLQRMFADPTVTVKQVARQFKITPRALRAPYVRKKLGLTHKKRCHGGNNSRGSLLVPKNGHHLVKKFFEIANREQATIRWISERAGLHEKTPASWRDDKTPGLIAFDAALRPLGFRLEIVSNEQEA